MDAVIEFRDVAIRRGKKFVVQKLSLSLNSGRIIGLLGPSGAGKSTVMRAIVGVQKGVIGDVTVLGMKPGTNSLLTRIAYSTQQSSVFDDLSVLDNLKFAANILGAPKERPVEVLKQVQLVEFAKTKVASLSGGQRNRVSLAMALVGDPEILILDEPTVGLDPVLRADLWGLFRTLANKGKTLLISSHVMDEAERCDEILFIRDGRVIAHDSLAQVLKDAGATSAEEAFLNLARRNDV